MAVAIVIAAPCKNRCLCRICPQGACGDLPRSKNRFCVGWASEADRHLFLLETPLEKIQKRLVFFGARGFDKGVVARPSLYPHAEHIKKLFILFKMVP